MAALGAAAVRAMASSSVFAVISVSLGPNWFPPAAASPCVDMVAAELRGTKSDIIEGYLRVAPIRTPPAAQRPERTDGCPGGFRPGLSPGVAQRQQAGISIEHLNEADGAPTVRDFGCGAGLGQGRLSLRQRPFLG